MPIDRLWVRITREELETERSQARDEGRVFERGDGEFERVHERLGENPYEHQDRAGDLLDRIAELPVRDDYEYEEPSDIEGIRAARPDERRSLDFGPEADDLSDRLLGASQGRCAGCLPGKPFETWERDRIRGFLDAADVDSRADQSSQTRS